MPPLADQSGAKIAETGGDGVKRGADLDKIGS
jgi:hypothetical protein